MEWANLASDYGANRKPEHQGPVLCLLALSHGLARAYLGLEQPDRALEIMRRREAYASPLGVTGCAPIQAKGVLLITGSLPLGESCPGELAFTLS